MKTPITLEWRIVLLPRLRIEVVKHLFFAISPLFFFRQAVRSGKWRVDRPFLLSLIEMSR